MLNESVVSTQYRRQATEKSSTAFVGMDVHKESIGVTLALLEMVRKLSSRANALVLVYEAGPCGFWIYREIQALGLACMVVSPALIPRRAGDQVKTDWRDSEHLASLARAGELAAILVPDIRDEAIRDLVRARDEVGIAQRWVRRKLKALLPRNDIRYVGRTSWTGAPWLWREGSRCRISRRKNDTLAGTLVLMRYNVVVNGGP